MNDMSEGQEVMTVESGTVALLNKSEIEQQVATAHRFPRSVSNFRKETLQMVTLSEKVAGECIYALPRDGKTIEGPSARFAEVIASAWGNSRAGARIVDEGAEFVTAQGVFHDLQRNVSITYEVKRRITDKNGRRYKPDMIGVTANAACSIALRNAILKGIPKAFWSEMYDAARHAAVGDVKSIANKRADAVKAFSSYGITEPQILKRLGREGVQDITIDDLIILAGFLTAIKDGDGSPESIFAEEAPQVSTVLDGINAKVKGGDTKTRPANVSADGELLGPTLPELKRKIDAAVATKNADALAVAESLIATLAEASEQEDARKAVAKAKEQLA